VSPPANIGGHLPHRVRHAQHLLAMLIELAPAEFISIKI